MVFCKVKGYEEIDFSLNLKAGRAGTSNIYIDSLSKYILKEQTKYSSYNLTEREVFLLTYLNEKNIDWVPKILGNYDNFILMEYCGETIKPDNIPNDYFNQISKILDELERLEIKHNDLYDKATGKIDILVKDGKLYVVDFGWASLKNQLNCGIEKIYNGKNICCMFNDRDIIGILDNFYDRKISNLEVCNRRTNVGSQSEYPELFIHSDYIEVKGYQQFKITNTNIIPYSKITKYTILTNIFNNLERGSIMDMGCSAGLVSYILKFLEFPKIYSYDHDIEYLNLIDKINSHYGFNEIITRKYRFGQSLPKVDYMVMLAIIHWIYSSTALFGNFDSIFSYLKPFINKKLLIEWVDNLDGAIKSFNHISKNKSIITEEYNQSNFEKSLTKIIGPIENKIIIDGSTRILYIVNSI